jgi:hypothetical protein
MSEFAILVDITTHLNESDMRLQGKDLFINSMSDHAKAFEIKLPSLAITVAKQQHFAFSNSAEL